MLDRCEKARMFDSSRDEREEKTREGRGAANIEYAHTCKRSR